MEVSAAALIHELNTRICKLSLSLIHGRAAAAEVLEEEEEEEAQSTAAAKSQRSRA